MDFGHSRFKELAVRITQRDRWNDAGLTDLAFHSRSLKKGYKVCTETSSESCSPGNFGACPGEFWSVEAAEFVAACSMLKMEATQPKLMSRDDGPLARLPAFAAAPPEPFADTYE